MREILVSGLNGSSDVGSRTGLTFDVANQFGHSAHVVTSRGGLCFLTTWLEDAVLVEGDPLIPASFDEIEPMFESHLERFDDLYRRWA